MRPLRVTLALAAATALLLAGCTDPSPDPDPTASSSSPADPSTSESSETSPDPSEEASSEAGTEPPVVGGSTGTGAASACLDAAEAADSQLTVSTTLTAVDDITIGGVTLDADVPGLEILDQYVLPAGQGGLTLGDYPPNDPDSAREDADGYALAAGETVTVGVGFGIGDDVTTLDAPVLISYHDSAGTSHTIESRYVVMIRETCGA